MTSETTDAAVAAARTKAAEAWWAVRGADGIPALKRTKKAAWESLTALIAAAEQRGREQAEGWIEAFPDPREKAWLARAEQAEAERDRLRAALEQQRLPLCRACADVVPHGGCPRLQAITAALDATGGQEDA